MAFLRRPSFFFSCLLSSLVTYFIKLLAVISPIIPEAYGKNEA